LNAASNFRLVTLIIRLVCSDETVLASTQASGLENRDHFFVPAVTAVCLPQQVHSQVKTSVASSHPLP
jgi:hypothetical protein